MSPSNPPYDDDWSGESRNLETGEVRGPSMTPIPPIPEDLQAWLSQFIAREARHSLEYNGQTSYALMVEFYEKVTPVTALNLTKRIAKLTAEVQTARRTAEYWKAEHLAGNTRIAQLEAELLMKNMGGSDYGPVTPDRGVPPPASRQLRHAMNCGAGYNAQGNEIDAEDCRCGLRYRIQLQTEQTMHAAWRKRAEEAEAENTRLKAPVSQRDWLMAQHEGDHMSTNPSRCARIATAIIRSRAPRTPPQEGQ